MIAVAAGLSIDQTVNRLNKLAYAENGFDGRPRANENGKLTASDRIPRIEPKAS